MRFSGTVVVLGSGITAVDAARTALRLGAEEVIVASPEADADAVSSRDVADAMEEGVKFDHGTAADQVLSAARSAGKTAGVTVISAGGGTAGATDRGAGQTLSQLYPEANRYTGRTSRRGVFAAGDLITGERSVIHAIAGGKRAALAVDAWLRGLDLEKLEEVVAAYDALPYLQQLDDEAEIGALGRRLAERAPVWLKMGASAEPAARADMRRRPAGSACPAPTWRWKPA